MHVIPNDEWYDRAKKATDRCDLELTKQVTGAKNGLADKVVWVSGLLDLKRGEAGAFSLLLLLLFIVVAAALAAGGVASISAECNHSPAPIWLLSRVAGNGEFRRSMDEYYRRFQTVIDNGEGQWRSGAAVLCRSVR
jgi:hypothetical protein